MRMIIFRGWNKSRKEWVYGNLMLHSFRQYGVLERKYFYQIDNNGFSNKKGHGFIRLKVEEKSIGQFTGFKDIDGHEIYEGDILQLPSGVGVEYKVVFELGGFNLIPLVHSSSAEPYSMSSNWYRSAKWKIVGNVYERRMP